jgi:hypothetical protein
MGAEVRTDATSTTVLPRPLVLRLLAAGAQAQAGQTFAVLEREGARLRWMAPDEAPSRVRVVALVADAPTTALQHHFPGVELALTYSGEVRGVRQLRGWRRAGDGWREVAIRVTD